MRIERKCLIEKVMSTEESRYTLTTGMIKERDGKFVVTATNGRVLVVVPVQMEEKDTPGRVTREALALSRLKKNWPKDDTKGFVCQIGLNGHQELKNGWKLPRPGDEMGHFPDIEVVIPKKGTTRDFVFSIDPKLLLDLAQAMGSKLVTLRVNMEAQDGILVEPSDGIRSDAIGVIMPVNCEKFGINEPAKKEEAASK